MADDPIINLFETFSLIAVFLTFLVFTRLAIKAPSLGSFRFQLSIFLLVWAISEIPHILDTLGLISISEYDPLGLGLHAMSMALFALFVGVKSLNFLKIRPPPSLPGATPFPQGPARPLGDMET